MRVPRKVRHVKIEEGLVEKMPDLCQSQEGRSIHGIEEHPRLSPKLQAPNPQTTVNK